MGGSILCCALRGSHVHAHLDLCCCHCGLSDCAGGLYLLQVIMVICVTSFLYFKQQINIMSL